MRKMLFGLLILICLGAAGWWWKRPQPLPVSLVEVASGPVESLIANSRAGTLKACQRSHLSFKLGGQVSELLIDEGQRVEQGQVLMRLRQDDQQARVLEAEASLASSRSLQAQRCQQALLDRQPLRFYR